MFIICKSHRSYLQSLSVYNRLKLLNIYPKNKRNVSHMTGESKPAIKQKSRNNHCFDCRQLSTEVKEDKTNNLIEEQINQLNSSNNLLLFCPKWSQMYDVFYSGPRPQSQHQLRDQTNDKHIKESPKQLNDKNVEIDDKPVNLLDTCEEWKPIERLNSQTLIKYYTQLSKLRLTGLVVLTTLSGFYMGLHSPFDWSMATLMAATLLGTGLTSASATTINQFLEIPFDSQMKRTQNRPLVLGRISSLHSCGFAAVTGVAGLTLLSYANPLTAALGATNLLLYSFIYTPMKRAHIANTWVGAIVGAIPPVMGYTAVNNCIDMSAILMGLLLYSWQFPHFNALSWNMRHEYARAGFRMMSVTEPKLCLNTALRHSCLIVIYSTLMCTTLTTWTFGMDSLPINLYLVYLSWKFRSNPDAKSSRKLFMYSLIHLPFVILLMCISKRRHKKNETIL